VNTNTKILGAATAALLLAGGITAVHAATTSTTASCTSAPTVSNVTAGQRITIVWTVPKLPAVTKTVTVTATPTPDPTPTDPPVDTTPTPPASDTPTPTPSDTPSDTPTETPTTSAPVDSGPCPASTPNTPGGPDNAGGCFPGTGNTGIPAGTTLKRVPQDVTSATQAGGTNTGWTWDGNGIKVTAKGAVLANLDVSGGVSQEQDAMQITAVRFRCTNIDGGNFCGALGADSTMTDSEIGGGADGHTFINSQGFWVGGSSAHNVIRRVEIHHIVHGLHIDGGTTVEDSYIHDMPAGDKAGNDPGTAHTDGVFVSTGSNMVFRHDTFANAANNCELFVQDYDNTAEGVSNLSVLSSLFIPTNRNGQQSSFGAGIENKDIKGPATIHVRDNVFGKGFQVTPIEAPTGADVVNNKNTDGSPAAVDWR
jgi:hypothetical protein